MLRSGPTEDFIVCVPLHVRRLPPLMLAAGRLPSDVQEHELFDHPPAGALG